MLSTCTTICFHQEQYYNMFPEGIYFTSAKVAIDKKVDTTKVIKESCYNIPWKHPIHSRNGGAKLKDCKSDYKPQPLVWDMQENTSSFKLKPGYSLPDNASDQDYLQLCYVADKEVLRLSAKFNILKHIRNKHEKTIEPKEKDYLKHLYDYWASRLQSHLLILKSADIEVDDPIDELDISLKGSVEKLTETTLKYNTRRQAMLKTLSNRPTIFVDFSFCSYDDPEIYEEFIVPLISQLLKTHKNVTIRPLNLTNVRATRFKECLCPDWDWGQTPNYTLDPTNPMGKKSSAYFTEKLYSS